MAHQSIHRRHQTLNSIGGIPYTGGTPDSDGALMVYDAATGSWTHTDGGLDLNDNDALTFGTGDDITLVFDGTDFIADHVGESGSFGFFGSSNSSIDLSHDGDDPFIAFWDSARTTRLGFMQISDTSGASLVNEQNSGLITLQGRSSAGSARNILIGDPDAETSIYNAGSSVCRTQSSGIDIATASSDNPFVGFYNDAFGTRLGYIQAASTITQLTIASEMTSANVRIFAEDGGGTARAMLDCDATTPVTSHPYHGTTASAATAYMDTVGGFYRSTSSAKYKDNIRKLRSRESRKVLDLSPVRYRSTCDRDNPSWSWYGLIAEEVAQIDPRLVHWAHPLKDEEVELEGGKKVMHRVFDTEKPLQPEAVQYDRLTVLLIDVVKEQQRRIERLEHKHRTR